MGASVDASSPVEDVLGNRSVDLESILGCRVPSNGCRHIDSFRFFDMRDGDDRFGVHMRLCRCHIEFTRSLLKSGWIVPTGACKRSELRRMIPRPGYFRPVSLMRQCAISQPLRITLNAFDIGANTSRKRRTRFPSFSNFIRCTFRQSFPGRKTFTIISTPQSPLVPALRHPRYIQAQRNIDRHRLSQLDLPLPRQANQRLRP